jgi:hypothetical protein
MASRPPLSQAKPLSEQVQKPEAIARPVSHRGFLFYDVDQVCTYWTAANGSHIVNASGLCRCGKHFTLTETEPRS